MTSPQHHRDHVAAVNLLNAGRFPEAASAFRKLQPILGMDPDFLANLATLQRLSGQPELAIRTYRQALARNPRHFAALVNLSGLLHQVSDFPSAIHYLELAIELSPPDHRLFNNLAGICIAQGDHQKAWTAIAAAHRLAPQDLGVALRRMTLAFELKDQSLFEQAAWNVIRLQGPEGSLLPYYLLANFLATYSRWDDLLRLHPELLTTLNRRIAAGQTLGVSPMQLCFIMDHPQAARHSAQAMLTYNASLAKPRPVLKPGPTPERLTIGYLAQDFHHHPVAHMLLPVLRRHDRSRFRILTLGLQPQIDTPLRTSISSHIDGHLDLVPLNDSAAARTIRAAEVDILVDLAGETQGARQGILAQRPASVQILWLGCPATTGAPWYDAFMVDAVAAGPEFRTTCTEPLVDLPGCYHPIFQGFGAPSPTMNRVKAGLPEDAFILGLLQLPTKVCPPFTEDLIEILRQAPDIFLWLRAKTTSQDLVREVFARGGIDPERLRFFPRGLERDDYLACHGLPDLLIDSYPYGGHSTTGEALSLGHPVVTRTGAGMHTRVAASMLHQMGLDDLVTSNREDHINKVLNLIRDPFELADVRARTQAAAARIRELACGPLTNHLEDAFTALHRAAPR